MERMSRVRTLRQAAAGFVALAALAALVALAGPAVAGGGGGDCAGFAEGDEVVLRDGCLDGIAHFAGDAGRITVVNEGGLPHDYTAVDGSFATGTLAAGESTPVEVPAGVHRVRCTLHSGAEGQGMAGVLVAGDPSTADELAAASTVGDDAAAWWRPSTSWTSGLTAGAVSLGVLGLLVRRRRRTPAR